MDTFIRGNGKKIVEVCNQTPTGLVHLTVVDSDGNEQEVQLSNSATFELAMTLLNCVEHTR